MRGDTITTRTGGGGGFGDLAGRDPTLVAQGVADRHVSAEAAARSRLDGRPPARMAVSNGMTAEHVVRLREAMPGVEQVLASQITTIMRMRKSPEEVAALRRTGQAIDRVHGRVEEWLSPG